MVSADRQSAGDEIIWQQKGAGQGTYTSENGRTLGHSSMQLIQVNVRYSFFFFSFLVSVHGFVNWHRNYRCLNLD